jgi:hypothetical protein
MPSEQMITGITAGMGGAFTPMQAPLFHSFCTENRPRKVRAKSTQTPASQKPCGTMFLRLCSRSLRAASHSYTAHGIVLCPGSIRAYAIEAHDRMPPKHIRQYVYPVHKTTSCKV